MKNKLKIFQLAKQKGLLKKNTINFADIYQQSENEARLPKKLTGISVELIKAVYKLKNRSSGGKKDDKRTL